MAQGGMPAAGFTPVVRVSAGERRSGAAVMRIGGLMLTAVCAVLAVAAISTRGSSTADRTELDMLKDSKHITGMHAAYIRGSVPTFADESDDIIAEDFPDETNGKAVDSMENAGAAYERGTHSTAESEASFITGVRKDKARTESLAMTKLGMSGEVANLANMHAAYIQGSVPTAMEESRDIITDDFPDETNGHKTTDGFDRMPEAYERGSKNTFGDEASAIIPGAEKDNARTESLAMTKLGMSGEVANLANMHAAYIQGSVPTAMEESRDIITDDFPDETNGHKTTDGFDRMPEAYERGSKNTFGDEASAIIPGAEKDNARTEALAAVNRLMAKRERELKGRKQMLGMSGDVANMANMHAAYIQGSVPTAKEESDDIITNDYPDETENAADSYEKQDAAYTRGSVPTSAEEAAHIMGEQDEKIRQLEAKVAILEQRYGKGSARTQELAAPTMARQLSGDKAVEQQLDQELTGYQKQFQIRGI